MELRAERLNGPADKAAESVPSSAIDNFSWSADRRFVVVGGGPQGVAYAAAIVEKHGPGGVVIVDNHSQLLTSWMDRTENTGMTFLRSPVGKSNLGAPRLVHPFWLPEPNYSPGPPDYFHYVDPYGRRYTRPSLALFNQHASAVIEAHDLRARHLQATATGLHPTDKGVLVSTDKGVIDATDVVLATGPNAPAYPEWAAALKQDGGSIAHVFDDGFSTDQIRAGEKVAVVGGGISGAQVSTKLGQISDQSVLMLTRRRLALSEIDNTLLDRALTAYDKLATSAERRRWITRTRRPGTLPMYALDGVDAATNAGQVRHEIGAVVTGHVTSSGESILTTSSGSSFAVDRVVLATGFQKQRPGGPMVDEFIAEFQPPLARDGYPIVESTLQWVPHVYATGGLADLRLGPAARNIFGSMRGTRDFFRHALETDLLPEVL